MPDDALIEKLDQAIDGLLAGEQPPASPELADLVQIAAQLRELPDEGFQKRLKSDLQRRATMTTSTAAPIREGFHTVTPYITVPEGSKLIDFLKHTFGAEELVRHALPAGFHAEVRIGDSPVMIGSGESIRGQEKLGAFHVYVPDCDTVYNRALEAGGTSMGAPSDHHYGERAGYVKDPAGNHWYIATHLGATPALESRWTVTPFLHPKSAAQCINFLTSALGATKLALYEDSGRVAYAAVLIGDAVVEMGEPYDEGSILQSMFQLYVEDCDASYKRAMAAGATSVREPADQPYGRAAGVQDSFGYLWFFATPLKDAR
jgi:uncharacterized glyoxalase superfamily protein PhnB